MRSRQVQSRAVSKVVLVVVGAPVATLGGVIFGASVHEYASSSSCASRGSLARPICSRPLDAAGIGFGGAVLALGTALVVLGLSLPRVPGHATTVALGPRSVQLAASF